MTTTLLTRSAAAHSARAARRPRSSAGRRAAFTLIELLIVILVMSILMAIALPLYLAAVSDSQVKTCRANMQTIADAEQAYKTQSTTHLYTTTLTNLLGNLGALPVCPNGGVYSVTISDGTGISNGKAIQLGGLIVSCSGQTFGGLPHGTYAPGVDSE